MMKTIFFVAVLALLSACNSAPSKSGEEKTSLSDSLFQAVMAGHDEAMPKVFKLERLQKETQAAIDSINKLPAATQAGLAAYKAQLDSTLLALDHGDFAMTKWMQEFKYDSLKHNEAERVKYLQSELEKVNKMKDAVLGSISRADSVLKK